MITGICLALLIIAVALTHNFYRNQKVLDVELIPNCLLTRYPILFISGYKSLFYFMNYFNHLPDFMREHGYEVTHLNLAWKSAAARNLQILDFFKNAEALNKKYHVFYDESIHDEIAPLLIQEKYESTVSINVLCPDSLKSDQSLKAPPIPIFEIKLTKSQLTFGQKLIWLMHRLLSISRPTPEPWLIGFCQNPDSIHYSLLDHSVTLAEMDLKST